MDKMTFEHNTFGKRLKSMLKVDFRRMFTMRLLYIMVGICLVTPVLILVMTTMMDGSVSVNPQTGEETIVEGFDNVWQIIGTVNDGGTGAEADAAMGMSMTAMCNINLLYFGVAVLVALFVADDFKSGYAKNLFTVRAKKTDYVISKTLVCLVCSVIMVFAFFAGSVVGGAIAGLPFDMAGFNASGLVMCMLSKTFLMLVFVPIYLAVSVGAKQKAWASILCACAVGALLFMMIPMLTPLNATIMNAGMCLAGGILFSIGLGAVSRSILNRTSLV